MSRQSSSDHPFVDGEVELERRLWKCARCGWLCCDDQERPFSQWCSECDAYTEHRSIVLR